MKYSERELIQRAIRNARPFARPEPRWVMVKRVFGTGSTVSSQICEAYGFDPEGVVNPLGEDQSDQWDKIVEGFKHTT